MEWFAWGYMILFYLVFVITNEVNEQLNKHNSIEFGNILLNNFIETTIFVLPFCGNLKNLFSNIFAFEV